jgi:diacylglycerol kinase family enzyme
LKWPYFEQQLKDAGISFDFIMTERRLHAKELAIDAIGKGYRQLVAVGGDGTANEVVNGIMEQVVCPSTEVTFTLLPVGTGNDWIKQYGIPREFAQWLQFFKVGNLAHQDVGWVSYQNEGKATKRFFINVAGLAYDAFVAKKAEAQGNRISNKFFYLLLVFRSLFQYKLPLVKVQFDGESLTRHLYTINIGICRYSGGGFQLVPHAVPDDGKLAMMLARRITKLEVLLLTPLFYSGKINWHPAISLHDVENISIESADGQTVLVEADGEFLGESPAQLGILKKALKIYTP